jgi:hypothetical protein
LIVSQRGSRRLVSWMYPAISARTWSWAASLGKGSCPTPLSAAHSAMASPSSATSALQ